MSELYHDYREPFSWRRTVGFAATFGIHAFAFIMLMAPIAPPAAKEKIKDAVVVVNFVEPPPPPPPPSPPPPEPPKKPPPKIVEKIKVAPPPPAPPPPAPVEAPPTPMSIPTPPAPPAPPPPPQDIAPSENISYRKMRPPRYPPQAVREHHSGKVILKVLIGLDGSPKDVTVEKSSGYRELDQAAIAAAKTWTFNPGSRNGKPYEGYALVPFDFNLTEL